MPGKKHAPLSQTTKETMEDLSQKTVAELKELAREREVAPRSEINKARKATLIEWLEGSGSEAETTPSPEPVPTESGEAETAQGELFPTTAETESSADADSSSASPEWDSPNEPYEENESSGNMMTYILIGLAILAVVLYFYD